MAEIITVQEAVAKVKQGDSLGTSGFLGVSAPIELIKGLVEAGTNELTLVQPVTGYPGEEHDVGKLAENRQIKKFVGAHTGTSKSFNKQFLAGEIEVDYVPMGTVVEMIRAGGAGLGAVVTPVGIGTLQEEKQDKIVRNGKEYLIYDPVNLDVAFVKANKADKYGNLYSFGTAKSISLELALASKVVIAEVDEIVEVGEIESTDVTVPGILVDYVVQGQTEEERYDYYRELWGRNNMLKGDA